MKTLEEIKNILVKHKPELKQKYKVKEIGILAPVLERKKKYMTLIFWWNLKSLQVFFQFMNLEEYLEKLLSAKVDLVSKKALKPRIEKHILKETIYL